MSIASAKVLTAEELFQMGDIGSCELINGELVMMAPAGFEHGGIAVQLTYLMKVFVDKHRLGMVIAGDTGFVLTRNPDTVRALDVAFVRKSRLPRRPHRRYFEGPPDLAVEVISPTDRKSEVMAKARNWLKAGAVSAWVVDPPKRHIEVYRKGVAPVRYGEADVLRDEPTLPGFALKLSDVFGEEE